MVKSLVLAGGCFWCVEHDLKEAPGIISVKSGYSGGDRIDPTYEHHERHKEVVLVEYDDTKTTYKKLLQYFIDHIDPTDPGGQFGDRGESYKTAIFYESQEERKIAESVIDELNNSGVYDKPSQIEILPRKVFYIGEDYHQGYSEKNPFHYNIYREASGRQTFINRTCQIRDEKHINWSS